MISREHVLCWYVTHLNQMGKSKIEITRRRFDEESVANRYPHMPVNCLARWVPNICGVTLTTNETILSICVAGQEFNVTIVSDRKKQPD